MNPWAGMTILYTSGAAFGLVWLWLCGGLDDWLLWRRFARTERRERRFWRRVIRVLGG